MRRFITDKSFYKTVLSITIPIALQNLIVFGVSMMDTIMLGQLGDVQLSASAQANQPTFIFQMINFGLAGGATVLSAQYWGKKDVETIRKIFAIVIRITVVTALILSTLALLFPQEIMKFYIKTDTPEDLMVLSEAVEYLKVIAFSYLFFGLSVCITFMLRSIEVVKVSVLTSSISFVVNVFLNWVLIFGNLGVTAMGIKGAALATLIARIVECTIVLIYFFIIDKKLSFKIKYVFQHDIQLLKDYFKYSFPVVVNEVVWSSGITLQAAILGKLSSDILAANSIAMVLQQLATLITFGVASAAAVLVGKSLGECDKEGARSTASTLMIWSVILGLFGSLTIFILRKPFVSIYNIEPEIKLLAENLLIITSILVFFISIAVNSIVGVLRGAGDTKFAFKVELIALWGIAIPCGFIAGYIVKAPILVAYVFLKIDEPIKSIVAFIKTTKEETYQTITRD